MVNRRNSGVGQLNWESTLRRKVEVMRELGIVAYDGIALGPVPPSVEVQKKTKSDPQYPKRSYYANLLNRPVQDDELARLPEVGS